MTIIYQINLPENESYRLKNEPKIKISNYFGIIAKRGKTQICFTRNINNIPTTNCGFDLNWSL